jgi:hypothetical protein
MFLTPSSIFLFVISFNISSRIFILLRNTRVTRESTVTEEYRILRLVSITKVKSVSREGLDYIITIGKVHEKAGLRTSSQGSQTEQF